MLSNKILVVEDNRDVRALLGILLASWGWDAVLAKSGREALDKLESVTPRVIFMDMRLPDNMSGLELAVILKSHPVYQNIPILATTGDHGHIARQRCLAAGCEDFLPKPFKVPALETRLAKLASLESPKLVAATG